MRPITFSLAVLWYFICFLLNRFQGWVSLSLRNKWALLCLVCLQIVEHNEGLLQSISSSYFRCHVYLRVWEQSLSRDRPIHACEVRPAPDAGDRAPFLSVQSRPRPQFFSITTPILSTCYVLSTVLVNSCILFKSPQYNPSDKSPLF